MSPRMAMSDAVQMVLDANGKILDVRRAKTAAPPPLTDAAGVSVWFDRRGVPAHACYPDPRETHPADRAFCATQGR